MGDAARRGWGPVIVGGALVAAAAGVAVWHLRDAPAPAGQVVAPPLAGPTAAPPPAAGPERTLLLHAIDPGPPPTARISMAGVAERSFGIGDAIAPGLRVATIAGNRVEVDARGRRLVLTLDASGRPGDRSGLDPEPVAAPPQLSGAEIERRQKGEPVRRTPEEEAAGVR